MANIDNAYTVEKLSLDDNVFITSLSFAPNTLTGYEAPVGSLSVYTGGSIWIKTGAADLNWSQLITASNIDISLQYYTENPSGSPVPAVALGNDAIALGYASIAQADKSIAIGEQSLTRHQNGMVFAGGRFGSTGDAQAGKYLLRTQTAGAIVIPVEAFLDGLGGSQRLILPDNSTWGFRAIVTAHRTDAGDGHACFILSGCVYRQNGATSVALEGFVNKEFVARSDSSWNVDASVDTTTGALVFFVSGESGKIIRWLISVDTSEVTN